MLNSDEGVLSLVIRDIGFTSADIPSGETYPLAENELGFSNAGSAAFLTVQIDAT